MSTLIRPELSETNRYWIEKHRYYELKHFCLQYPLWRHAYNSLIDYPGSWPQLVPPCKTNVVSDPVTKHIDERLYQCALIAEKAHEMGLSVWCYTGYLFEDLYRQGIELLKHIDVLVDGPFVQAEKSLDLDFRGSRNQRVIDIPESLKEGVAILKQT